MEKKDQTQGGAGFSGYTKNTKSQQITTSEMKQEETNNNSTAHDNECTVREQDRFMPLANVIRLMRKVIPRRAKISDDAKETIQECVSEFISFVTSEANVRCQQEYRKTITAEDILWAMSSLGFDNYVEPLTVYINRYRESEAGGERGSFRGEAFVQRSFDAGVMPIAAAFPPGYYMAPNGGFLGAMAMRGFLMDARNAGPSGAAAAAANTPETFTKCEE